VTPHLPYAYRDEDEFHHPVDGWLLLDRSVVYDSWISWRHVLPQASRDCQDLTPEINGAILTLASELHAVHQRMPGYRDLGESPFRIVRWWDPLLDHPWNTGQFCVFFLENCSNDEFISHWRSAESTLHLEVLPSGSIRARLTQSPAAVLGSLLPPDAARPRERARRRKRQSPPLGTPGCDQTPALPAP